MSNCLVHVKELSGQIVTNGRMCAFAIVVAEICDKHAPEARILLAWDPLRL